MPQRGECHAPRKHQRRRKMAEKPLVLVVDDDPNVVALARAYLERDGYRVSEAGDGLRALELARREQPCLVVLDLMLPGLDGLEVCRRLQVESMAPVIMLTARVEEADRLEGLNLGADDYITKPFSPRELAARVRAVLRRSDRESAVSAYPELFLRRDQGQPAHPESDGGRRGARPDANGVPAADPPASGTRQGVLPQRDHRQGSWR